MSNHSRPIPRHLSTFPAPTLQRVMRSSLLLLLSAAAMPSAAAQPSTDSSSSDFAYSNFNPSMAIIIVVLACAFVFMGFFSIYIRHCSDEDASGAQNPRNSAAARRRGLDRETIDSFPVFRYSEVKDLKMWKGALECAVCLAEFENDDDLRLLPKCDHVFHPECIDAWLASHTTCPVCRSNLTPTDEKVPGENAQVTESTQSIDSAGEFNFRSELGEVQNRNQISIDIGEDQNRDLEANHFPKPNRQRMARLSRSHSTGHSLVQLGEYCERYTLRLPVEVRKQILKRTKSCVVVLPTEGSCSRGYRGGGGGGGGCGGGGGEGSSRGRWLGRSDRWLFTMTPPFFSRSRSMKPSPKVGVDGDVVAVGGPKLFLSSPFHCLAVKGDGVEQTSTRPQV